MPTQTPHRPMNLGPPFKGSGEESSGGTWGTIGGTLSDQTDLQAQLDGIVAGEAGISGAAAVTWSTGGGGSNLDSLNCGAAGYTSGTIVVLGDGNTVLVVAGTNASDANTGYIRPANYATTTNEFVFKLT